MKQQDSNIFYLEVVDMGVKGIKIEIYFLQLIEFDIIYKFNLKLNYFLNIDNQI